MYLGCVCYLRDILVPARCTYMCIKYLEVQKCTRKYIRYLRYLHVCTYIQVHTCRQYLQVGPTCMYLQIRTGIFWYINVDMVLYILACTQICIQVHIRVHRCTPVHICELRYTEMHVATHRYMYVHLGIHRCIYVHNLHLDAHGSICMHAGTFAHIQVHLCTHRFVCLLLLYVLATSKVISGRVPTCDSAHSW